MVLVNREDKEFDGGFHAAGTWNEKPVADELNNKPLTISAGRITLSMAPKSVRILSVSSGKAEH